MFVQGFVPPGLVSVVTASCSLAQRAGAVPGLRVHTLKFLFVLHILL